MVAFEKKALVRIRNRFPPKSDLAAVVEEVLSQKITGEIHIGIPGNGSISYVEFLEKERVHGVSTENT